MHVKMHDVFSSQTGSPVNTLLQLCSGGQAAAADKLSLSKRTKISELLPLICPSPPYFPLPPLPSLLHLLSVCHPPPPRPPAGLLLQAQLRGRWVPSPPHWGNKASSAQVRVWLSTSSIVFFCTTTSSSYSIFFGISVALLICRPPPPHSA